MSGSGIQAAGRSPGPAPAARVWRTHRAGERGKGAGVRLAATRVGQQRAEHGRQGRPGEGLS